MDFIKGNDEPLCYFKQDSKQLIHKHHEGYAAERITNIKTNGVVLTSHNIKL